MPSETRSNGSAEGAGPEVLLQLYEATSTASEERPLLRRALEALARALVVDAAEVRTLERGSLRVRHRFGRPIAMTVLEDTAIRVRVMDHGETVALQRGSGAAAALALPLRSGDRVLGVVLLERDGAGFDAATLELLERAADHLGRALERVRVFRRAVLDAERLERSLAQREADLEEKERELASGRWLAALGQLAAGVAHDLNNALNPIVSFAELIRTGTEDEQLRTYADRIRTAAADGAMTVQRIQSFTRQRRSTRAIEMVPLAAAVREAVDLARTSWNTRSSGRIEVSESIAPDLFVRGSAAEIREAMLNLLGNAADSMAEGGTIRVVARSENRDVIIAVQDTGCGMTDEVRQRALEPFFTTKGMHGTGLGLSEVFGIVRRQNGDLEIESWPDVGTTILLRLPAATAEEQPRVEKAAGPAVAIRPCRILLVDDNLLSVEATAAALRNAGHTVSTAASAEEALQGFEVGACDVLLTDIGLPGQSGWELIDAVRAADPQVRLGLITGWDLDRDADDVARRGVELVFLKPVDPEEMLDALVRTQRPGEAAD